MNPGGNCKNEVQGQPYRHTIDWVNSAKGIGVILVVLGHLLYKSNLSLLNRWIYSFHMPLFFVLAGYVQSTVRPGFLRRRVKQLVVPWLVFAIMGLPYFGWLMYRKGKSLGTILLDTFYINGKTSNSPLWYLVVFFEICFIVWLFRLPERSSLVLSVAFVLTMVLGYATYVWGDVLSSLNYLGFNRMIMGLEFFVLGILLRRLNQKGRMRAEWRLQGVAVQGRQGKLRCQFVLLLIISAIINIVFGVAFNPKVTMYGFDFGNYCYFEIAAISGSVMIMSICVLFLDRPCYLTKLSRYAILLLGIQYFAISPFSAFVQRIELAGSLICNLLILIVAMVLLIFVPFLYEKFGKRFRVIRCINGELA